MNNDSIFFAFAGSELSLASKSLLIQQSLETNTESSDENSIKPTREKKKNSLTRTGFPFQNQNSEKISE